MSPVGRTASILNDIEPILPLPVTLPAGCPGSFQTGILRKHSIVAVDVHLREISNLLQIREAGDVFCACPRLIQSGQQHRRENCDDRNDHEELDECKSLFHSFVPLHFKRTKMFGDRVVPFCYPYIIPKNMQMSIENKQFFLFLCNFCIDKVSKFRESRKTTENGLE